MSRKAAREYAYQLVFEYLMTKDNQTPTKEQVFQDPNLTMQDAEYINSVYSGVAEKYDELIDYVVRHSKTFKLERIFKPDLAALLLAIYEMKYIDDIPQNVSINEAIEISKQFATDKSYQFINGVLSGVYKELNQ